MQKEKKKKMTRKDKLPVCLAIIGLIILEAIALLKGIDGTLFTIVIAAIAGLGGYVLQTPLRKK